MAFNVEEFKSQLEFGGARASLFQVLCNFPSEVDGSGATLKKLSFMARAAALPESEIGVISLPYFGRPIKFAGDRTFGSWAITVINDEDFAVRDALEQWHQLLNDRELNVRDPDFVPPSRSYKQNIDIIQYGQDGSKLRQYTLIGAFPVNISAIALDWATTNRVEEFNTVFAYDYWNVAQLS